MSADFLSKKYLIEFYLFLSLSKEENLEAVELLGIVLPQSSDLPFPVFHNSLPLNSLCIKCHISAKPDGNQPALSARQMHLLI